MLFLLLFAVLLHEIGHILLLWVSGGKLRGISLSLCGITLQAEYPPSYLSKILISLGGPLIGILAFFCCHGIGGTLHQFAEINLTLSLFNLLPISFLDGGSILNSLLLLFLPYEMASQISRTLSLCLITLLWSFSVYLFLFLNSNPSLFFLSLWFFFSLLGFKEKQS